MDNPVELLQDYRRVRFEEYFSAAVFGLGMIVLGYGTFEGLKSNDNTPFSTQLCCYLMVACSSLSSSSFEQGRKMSREVSRLEKELENG